MNIYQEKITSFTIEHKLRRKIIHSRIIIKLIYFDLSIFIRFDNLLITPITISLNIKI